MNWNEFCEKLKCLLGRYLVEKIEFSYDDSKITYSLSSQKIEFTRTNYNDFVEKVSAYHFESASIYNEKYSETIIQSKIVYSGDKLLDIKVNDDSRGIDYSFQYISNEMIWYILNNCDFSTRTMLHSMSSSFIERRLDSLENKDIFSVVRIYIRNPIAIVVNSNNPIKPEKFNSYIQSFLFNFTYNNDYVLKPLGDIKELFSQRTHFFKRRATEYISPPYLSYKKELIEQYYMALMSDDPFVKFIGFYHIMEYFYDEVYREDIYLSVQEILKHPKFSPYRDKDVIKLIELIRKKTRQNKEEFQGTELEALELTLKKYVPLDDLVNELNEYDSKLIEYYCATEVSFSNGDRIDLRNTTDIKLFKKLAARIYKTRNSLVHSKSNEFRNNDRGIYSPFTNGKELSKEIPLMRIISEIIIIKSASSF